MLKNPFVKKAVLETRFRLRGTYYDRRGAIVDSQIGSFQRVGFDKNGTLGLMAADESETFSIGPKTVNYRLLDPKDLDSFVDRVLPRFDEVLSILEVDEVDRIGFRCTWLTPYKGKFHQAVRDITTTMHPQHDNLWHVFEGSPADAGYPFVFTFENFGGGLGKANVNFGPMDKNQLKNDVGDFGRLPDVALFLDTDIMVNSDPNVGPLKVSKLIDTVRFCAEKQEQFTWGIVDFLRRGSERRK